MTMHGNSRWIIRIITTVFCFFTIAHVSAAGDKSPVWKISHGGNSVYLGGTIHALVPEDYPLPKGFEVAYNNADIVVLETDISKMQAPETQALLLGAMLYQDGRTLKRVLSPSVYQELSQFIAQRGGNIVQFDTFKPGMLSILLTLDELKRLQQLGQGVDEFFDQRAQKDNKIRLFLETIEQQLGFLSSMGEGQEDHFIRYSLAELENTATMLKSLKQAWRGGDEADLATVGIDEWRSEFPRLYQSLLVQRNNAWLPHVDAMLNTAPTEAVFVGALHLVGEDGLLHQLRQKGYVVEQLP